MTSNPNWWRNFERDEAERMERTEAARDRLREWRAKIAAEAEWVNMTGEYAPLKRLDRHPRPKCALIDALAKAPSG